MLLFHLYFRKLVTLRYLHLYTEINYSITAVHKREFIQDLNRCLFLLYFLKIRSYHHCFFMHAHLLFSVSVFITDYFSDILAKTGSQFLIRCKFNINNQYVFISNHRMGSCPCFKYLIFQNQWIVESIYLTFSVWLVSVGCI